MALIIDWFPVEHIVCFQNDGGSPISSYMVEKKGPDGKWKPVSKFVRGTRYEVPDLEEGEKYEFRVSAINEQGVSEPLTCDKPITAKNPFGEHHSYFIIKWIGQKCTCEGKQTVRVGFKGWIML